MLDFELKKFKSLQGRARDSALIKYNNINDNDIVIVKITGGVIPLYEIEKIDGDPLRYLMDFKL